MIPFPAWLLSAFIGGHSVAGVSAEDALRVNPAALFDLRGWSANVRVDSTEAWHSQVV